MKLFYPSTYFDLTDYSHSLLFDDELPVWITLKKIKPYLLSLRLGSIQGIIEPGAYLSREDQISIGKGTIVEPGAYIQGPCVIGENCTIRHGAYLRGYAVVGDRCVIGHATEIKNSIILNDACAGHFAYIGDSIIGNRVNLGAGTKCANLRFDHLPISIIWNGMHIDSTLSKLGAILGDGVQTGCNAVTSPGTLMGKDARLYPLIVGSGIVSQETRIKSPELSSIS